MTFPNKCPVFLKKIRGGGVPVSTRSSCDVRQHNPTPQMRCGVRPRLWVDVKLHVIQLCRLTLRPGVHPHGGWA